MTQVSPHGLHHVTAIATDPQSNVDFYTRALGLRLVKQTVNFDAPETYHLYYGDEQGSPSSLLTFFPWPGLQAGRQGAGMTTATAFSVPGSSLGWWHATVRRSPDRRGPAADPRRGRGAHLPGSRRHRDRPGRLRRRSSLRLGRRRRDPGRARRTRPARDHPVGAAARSVGHHADRSARDEPDRRGRRPGPVRHGRWRLRCPGRRVRRGQGPGPAGRRHRPPRRLPGAGPADHDRSGSRSSSTGACR